jgi:hypothetical protein
MVNRLNTPLPDEVLIRYYLEHPDKPLSPEHEHLRAAVDRGRASSSSNDDSTTGE